MGYFDIQVNGYGGVDFNHDDLSPEDLHRACLALRADGVDGILATIVTEFPEKMIGRLRRLVELREGDPLARELIAGLHIEGPFINPREGYRGAHPLHAIRPADEVLCGRLVEAGGGLVRILTLAPEEDRDGRVIRFLARQRIIVSAGHTDASLDQLREAIDSGLSMMTHLGNGCPITMARHDNIIQRALFLREHLWLSFIADGIHIPLPTLRNYLDLACDRGRCLVTTDAISAAGLGPGTHRINRWTLVVKEDLAVWAPDGSSLVGSAVPMKQAHRNLSAIGLSPKAIELMTNQRPRQSVGLGS